jgi:hypothetical protein
MVGIRLRTGRYADILHQVGLGFVAHGGDF